MSWFSKNTDTNLAEVVVPFVTVSATELRTVQW